uniref:Antimicrobial peptide 1 n=1 Tax=Anthurium amnicola TaxID=1678845 RepID=A0A1D1YHA9_9ARAE
MASFLVPGRVGVAVLLVLVAAVFGPADASNLALFEVIGCRGNSESVGPCGSCYNLTHYGGYSFVYTGQTAVFYNAYNCDGSNGVSTLNECDAFCGGLKFYRSVIVGCSSTAAE